MAFLLTTIGEQLAKYLSTPTPQASQVAIVSLELLAATLRPGDVLLIDGNTRISVAIKYLTQSTWSHAALFIGGMGISQGSGQESKVLIEADIRHGVRAVSLGEYAGLHTRICRPVGLSPDDMKKLIGHAVARIGHRYDLKNVIDLARYLIPTPPVPVRWRRRMIAFGSGDPSRAICSTMIAQAFQSVRYPILPEVSLEKADDPACNECYREVLHIRHYSLFAPRDFDISPYFEVVKPTLLHNFDYHQVRWAADSSTLSSSTL